MDNRSAGLIMLSVLIMWAQHRHEPLGSAWLASEGVQVRYQARMAPERSVLERNGGITVFEGSDDHLPRALSALTHLLSVFQQAVATLRRTLDEVRNAALLFGWQVLGDERPLLALLHSRQFEPGVCPARQRIETPEFVETRARAGSALHATLAP
jgi:hypothetical protein